MLFWLFCMLSEGSLLKIPRTNRTEPNSLPSLPSFVWSDKSEIQTAKWQMMDATFVLDYLYSFHDLTHVSETFHQRCAMPQPQNWGARDSRKKNLKRFRLCSQLPEAFVKTKEVHAKFEAEEDFRVVTHKQRKKSLPLKEHDEEFGKQEEIFGVCLPSASAWASCLDRKGRAGFETVWLQRSNHFFPISLRPILSLSLVPLSPAHTDQTLLSMTPLCIAMNTNQQD